MLPRGTNTVLRRELRREMANRAFLRLILLVAVICGQSGSVSAQQFEVTGSVTFPDGSAVAGVTVELLQNDKLLSSATTDTEGEFRFRVASATETYVIRAVVQGFSETEQPF